MLTQKHYGTTADGSEITEYTLTNTNNMTVSIINYGAIITSVTVPDKDGKAQEITLGFNKLEDYMHHNDACFGATVGRVAGRIRDAKFTVNNTVYHLAKNAGEDSIHGGEPGFHRVVWNAESYEDEGASGVVLSYLSLDGEAGYPGNVAVVLSYHLTDDNELLIEYEAETDFATPFNLTNHTYWNLAGPTSGSIANHHAEIFADEYLKLDETLLPTGEIAEIDNDNIDFSEPKAIGDYPQDQCYVLGKKPSELLLAAVIVEPQSGRKLECYTTQTGLQFYTGGNLTGQIGREGKAYDKFSGLCLEAQNWPNAINQNNFPNSLLKPGKTYQHTICYQLYF